MQLQDLKQSVSIVKWRYTDAAPRPPWKSLQVAPVWVDPRFESLRASLKTVERATLTQTGEGKVARAHMKTTKRTATLFNTNDPEIPKSIAESTPRGLVAILTPEFPNVTNALLQHADITPLMLFGDKESVKVATAQVRQQQSGQLFKKIRLYVRPKQLLPTDDRKLREYQVMLVAQATAIIPVV